MADSLEKVKIVRSGDVPGEIDASGVETGEAGRYYTRMQYKERQFLRAKDFQAEQEYNIEKMRDHNKALHSYGICETEEGGTEGLKVSIATETKYAKCVKVSQGMAIDRLGNTILLTETEILDLSSACYTNAYVTEVLLYISYGVANASDKEYNLDEGGFTGCTRTVEKPEFKVCPSNNPSLDIRYLPLALITRNATTGNITSCNNSPPGRQTAGVKVSKIGSNELADNSVKTNHLLDNAVTAAKLATGAAVGNITDGSLSGAKLSASSVDYSKLASGAAIGNIADNTLNGAKLVNTSVASGKLASGAAVGNITDGGLSGAKLTASSVDYSKLASGAAVANIVDSSLNGAKLTNSSVSFEKLYKSTFTSTTEATIPTNTFYSFFSVAVEADALLSPFGIHYFAPNQSIKVYSCRTHLDFSVYGFYEIEYNPAYNNYRIVSYVYNNTDSAVKLKLYYWHLL